MRATIQRLGALDGWKDSVAITERTFNTENGGAYIPETRKLSLSNKNHIENPSLKPAEVHTSKSKPLDEAVQAAMKKSEKQLHRELGSFCCPEQAVFHDRVTIRDHKFTTYRTSENHGVIFFQEASDTCDLVPGMVRAIFQVTQDSTTHTFLAIHRYLTPKTSLPNPFACYPDFGASLWSSETQKEVTIVPGNRRIYHAIYRDWDYKILVMKPLNRVSIIALNGDSVLTYTRFPRIFDGTTPSTPNVVVFMVSVHYLNQQV